MFNKLLFSSLSFLFVSCSSFPGDIVKEDKDSETGKKSSPIIISENDFYSTNDSNTYYEFELKDTSNSCQMIVYSRDTFSLGFTLSSSSSFQENVSSNFSSFKNMNDGTYKLMSKPLYNNDEKITVYSPCLKGSDTVSSLFVGENQNFTEYYKLYTFELSDNSSIKISKMSNMSDITLMDLDFESISYYFGQTKILDKGKYYFLVRGTKDDTISKFKFEVLD